MLEYNLVNNKIKKKLKKLYKAKKCYKKAKIYKNYNKKINCKDQDFIDIKKKVNKKNLQIFKSQK